METCEIQQIVAMAVEITISDKRWVGPGLR